MSRFFVFFTAPNVIFSTCKPGNSGASVVVFAPAAVTLPQSWPRPRACAAEVRGPPAEPGGSPGSVPGPDKLSH